MMWRAGLETSIFAMAGQGVWTDQQARRFESRLLPKERGRNSPRSDLICRRRMAREGVASREYEVVLRRRLCLDAITYRRGWPKKSTNTSGPGDDHSVFCYSFVVAAVSFDIVVVVGVGVEKIGQADDDLLVAPTGLVTMEGGDGCK